MKLEEQVITLAQAERLHQIGIRRDSLFAYVDGKLEYMPMQYDYSAYTLSEIMGMIPLAGEDMGEYATVKTLDRHNNEVYSVLRFVGETWVPVTELSHSPTAVQALAYLLTDRIVEPII